MSLTPQKSVNEVKSPGKFTPVSVQESPVSKISQKGNLTGSSRVVRDHVADAYNLVQKWNTHQILGGRIVKNIVALKVTAFSEDSTEGTSLSNQEGLQELCDQLDEVYIIMAEVVSTLQLIHKQMEAVVKLDKLGDSSPLFILWPVEKFAEVLSQLYEAYASELKVKQCVKENLAYCRCRASLMLHAAAWAHQPYILPCTDRALESMLLETGHR